MNLENLIVAATSGDQSSASIDIVLPSPIDVAVMCNLCGVAATGVLFTAFAGLPVFDQDLSTRAI
jgi:hypothetical protein